MRILLTGACGMLGRAIRRVGAADHEFVLLDITEDASTEGGVCASITDESAVFGAAEGCDDQDKFCQEKQRCRHDSDGNNAERPLSLSE